ncbi:hypothetical protein [Nocardioides sp.]|uniref:hypothetical protein n=1 Tax=Nocardioides sp. TaxID=35761 RepID=UPI002B7A2BBF|nr:hypothetical protein [Nocardioides sp.]HXH80656.1 hypothetical protein [Nocardioides sp.]
MWDFTSSGPGDNRYLVLGFTQEPAEESAEPTIHDHMIAAGPLLSDDGSLVLGVAVLLEATDAEAARRVLPTDRYVGIEAHQWRFGGRPD